MPNTIGGWEAAATQLAVDRSTTLDRGLYQKANMLEQLAERIHTQQQEQWAITEKKEAVVSRLAKVEHVNTALTFLSTAFRVGAGAGLLTSNPVTGCALMSTALFTTFRTLATKLEWTQSISQSLGGTKEEIKQRELVINRSLAGFDVAASLASVFMGDSTAIVKTGWRAISAPKVSAEGITLASSGVQGFMMAVRARLEGKKGDVEQDGLRNRQEGVKHQALRTERQGELETYMQFQDNLYTHLLEMVQSNQRITLKMRRNLGD